MGRTSKTKFIINYIYNAAPIGIILEACMQRVFEIPL
jgi:hypothetical protein